MTTQTMPVVTVVDGAVTTLSTDVATFFGKNHRDVVRSIENILSNLPENRVRNFAQTVVTRENPSGGAPIKSKAYRLTRDGFTFLAMGFTGERAQAFKWAYIDAFNKMEASLYQCPAKDQLPPPVLTEQQAYQIMSEVAKRAKRNGTHYQTIYRALKARYQVTKYTHIPREMFEDAIKFIQTMTLTVPETPKQSGSTEQSGRQFTVNESFVLKVRDFTYLWKYLFREDLELFYRLLVSVQSPMAPKFYEAVHDLNLSMLEACLDRLGYPVKELDCYKHWALAHAA